MRRIFADREMSTLSSMEEFLDHFVIHSFNSMEPKWEKDKFERPLIRFVIHMQVKVTLIQPADPFYPRRLENAFDHNRLPAIAAAGNLDLLQGRMLGLFCSRESPGDIILRTYDLVRALRDAGIPIIGGFHSPMEKECLSLLIRGTEPFLICPARSLEGMRLPSAWKKPLD